MSRQREVRGPCAQCLCTHPCQPHVILFKHARYATSNTWNNSCADESALTSVEPALLQSERVMSWKNLQFPGRQLTTTSLPYKARGTGASTSHIFAEQALRRNCCSVSPRDRTKPLSENSQPDSSQSPRAHHNRSAVMCRRDTHCKDLPPN